MSTSENIRLIARASFNTLHVPLILYLISYPAYRRMDGHSIVIIIGQLFQKVIEYYQEHNHPLQTEPRHHEEESQDANNHKISIKMNSRGARDSKNGKKWPESSRILDSILS